MLGLLPAPVLYAVALLTTAVAGLLAVCLRAGLESVTPGQSSGPIFFVAVVFSAWYGGIGPGLLAAALSWLCLEFLFLPPFYEVEVYWHDLPWAIAFMGCAVVVSRIAAERRQTETALHRTDEMLRGAQAIQQRLYPIRVPELPGVAVAGASFPADTVGGDYFDYIPLPGGATGVVVGDISGHGLGPALLMAEARAYLRALALTHDDIGEILTLTNRVLAEDTEEEFLTVFFASVEPHTRRFTYAAAGHEAYLLEPDGAARRLPSTSLPLGVDRNLVVPCAPPISLVPGQVVLLFTDGVYETHSPEGTCFGLERALDVVRANRTRSAREIIESLHAELRSFASGQPQQDDITVIVLKIQAQA